MIDKYKKLLVYRLMEVENTKNILETYKREYGALKSLSKGSTVLTTGLHYYIDDLVPLHFFSTSADIFDQNDQERRILWSIKKTYPDVISLELLNAWQITLEGLYVDIDNVLEKLNNIRIHLGFALLIEE